MPSNNRKDKLGGGGRGSRGGRGGGGGSNGGSRGGGRGESRRNRSERSRTNFRGNAPLPQNNRFSSLSTDDPTVNTKKNVFGAKSKPNKPDADTKKETHRFKELDEGGNRFTKPRINTNSRWKRDEKSSENSKGKYVAPFQRQQQRQQRRNDVPYAEKSRNRFSKKMPSFDITKEEFPTLSGKQEINKKGAAKESQEHSKEEDTKKSDVQNGIVNERVNDTDQITDEENKETGKKLSFKSAIKYKKKKFTPLPKYNIEPGWVHMKLVKGKIIKRYGPPIHRPVRKVYPQVALKKMFYDMQLDNFGEYNGETYYKVSNQSATRDDEVDNRETMMKRRYR